MRFSLVQWIYYANNPQIKIGNNPVTSDSITNLKAMSLIIYAVGCNNYNQWISHSTHSSKADKIEKNCSFFFSLSPLETDIDRWNTKRAIIHYNLKDDPLRWGHGFGWVHYDPRTTRGRYMIIQEKSVMLRRDALTSWCTADRHPWWNLARALCQQTCQKAALLSAWAEGQTWFDQQSNWSPQVWMRAEYNDSCPQGPLSAYSPLDDTSWEEKMPKITAHHPQRQTSLWKTYQIINGYSRTIESMAWDLCPLEPLNQWLPGREFHDPASPMKVVMDTNRVKKWYLINHWNQWMVARLLEVWKCLRP